MVWLEIEHLHAVEPYMHSGLLSLYLRYACIAMNWSLFAMANISACCSHNKNIHLAYFEELEAAHILRKEEGGEDLTSLN